MRGGQWGVALSHLTPAIPQSHPAEPGYAASPSSHCGQVAMRQALLGLGHLHAQNVIHKARPGLGQESVMGIDVGLGLGFSRA